VRLPAPVDAAPRRAGAWGLWWIAVFWLWILLCGEWNAVEWIAAACAATVTATVAETVRALAGLRWRIPARDIAAAWNQPLQVVIDFGIVVGALLVGAARLRTVRGRFLVRTFHPARGLAPRRFGSRAFRTYVATISPNAYVVDVDEQQRTVLFHDLVPYRKSEEPAA
jgi:hypothetical protein